MIRERHTQQARHTFLGNSSKMNRISGQPHPEPSRNRDSGDTSNVKMERQPSNDGRSPDRQPVPHTPSLPKDIPDSVGQAPLKTFRADTSGTNQPGSRYQARWRAWRARSIGTAGGVFGRRQDSQPKVTNAPSASGGAPWRQVFSSFSNTVATTVDSLGRVTTNSHTDSHLQIHTHSPAHTRTCPPTIHRPAIPRNTNLEPLNASYEVVHRPSNDGFVSLSDDQDTEEDDGLDVISLSSSDSDLDSTFDLINEGDLSPRSRRARRKSERENRDIRQGLDDLGQLFKPTLQVSQQRR